VKDVSESCAGEPHARFDREGWKRSSRHRASPSPNQPRWTGGLVDYYRRISGEHRDWDEYRRAMQHQQRVLVRVLIDTVGPPRRLACPRVVASVDPPHLV
jgi:hypothetical protein